MSGNTMTVQNFTNSIYILGFCARAKYPMLNYLPSWHFATARWYVLEKKFVNLCFMSKQVKNFSNKNKVNNSKRNYAGAVCWLLMRLWLSGILRRSKNHYSQFVTRPLFDKIWTFVLTLGVSLFEEGKKVMQNLEKERLVDR